MHGNFQCAWKKGRPQKQTGCSLTAVKCTDQQTLDLALSLNFLLYETFPYYLYYFEVFLLAAERILTDNALQVVTMALLLLASVAEVMNNFSLAPSLSS